MRTITVKSKKLVDVWNKRKDLFVEVRKYSEQKDAIDKEMNKLAIKLEKLKEDSVKETKKLNIPLEEFETITQFDLIEGDTENVSIEIADELELYKEAYRKRRAEQSTS